MGKYFPYFQGFFIMIKATWELY